MNLKIIDDAFALANMTSFLIALVIENPSLRSLIFHAFAPSSKRSLCILKISLYPIIIHKIMIKKLVYCCQPFKVTLYYQLDPIIFLCLHGTLFDFNFFSPTGLNYFIFSAKRSKNFLTFYFTRTCMLMYYIFQH